MKFYKNYTRDEVCEAFVKEMLPNVDPLDQRFLNTIEKTKGFPDEVLLDWASYNL